MTNPSSAVRKTRQMVLEFSNVQTFKWVGVALVIHLAFIAAASVPYLRDLADPGGAAARKAALSGGDKAASQPASQPSSQPASQPASSAAPDKTTAPSPTGSAADDKALQDHKDAPVVKRITATAAAPIEPNSAGIGLDETPGR